MFPQELKFPARVRMAFPREKHFAEQETIQWLVEARDFRAQPELPVFDFPARVQALKAEAPDCWSRNPIAAFSASTPLARRSGRRYHPRGQKG